MTATNNENLSWIQLVDKYNIRECKNKKCLALISDIGGPARKSSADIMQIARKRGRCGILDDSNICEGCEEIANWNVDHRDISVHGNDHLFTMYQGLIEYLFNNCEEIKNN